MRGAAWQWDVQRVTTGLRIAADDDKLRDLLADGWEPFATTNGESGGYVYHLRRKVQSGGGTDG